MPIFADPTSGDRFSAAEANGHLLLVKPLSVEADINTANGVKDAIRVDVADLSTGQTYFGTMWFGGVLIGSLRTRIGQLVLGTMGQGQGKPGQNPPWVIKGETQNPAAVQAAEAYLAANPSFDPANAPAPAPTEITAFRPGQPTAAPQQPVYQPTASNF